MTRTEIFENVRKYMLEELHFEDITEEDILPETLLFDQDEGLGLDSLDAVELVTLLDKHFGVEIKDPALVKEHFTSMNTLVDFIASSNPVLR